MIQFFSVCLFVLFQLMGLNYTSCVSYEFDDESQKYKQTASVDSEYTVELTEDKVSIVGNDVALEYSVIQHAEINGEDVYIATAAGEPYRISVFEDHIEVIHKAYKKVYQ